MIVGPTGVGKTKLSIELAKKYSQWRAYWTTKAKKPNVPMWQFGGETNYVRTNIVAW